MRQVAYLAGIVLAIAVASHFAFDLTRAGTAGVFVWIGVPTVALAIVGVLRARYDGVLKHWASAKSGDFTRGFVGAALLFGASFMFMRTVAPPDLPRASWLARLYLQLGDPSELRKHVGSIVVAILVMAVAEEIVWRGFVTSLLEEKVGSRRAWIWSAVLYALAHVPTAWQLKDPVSGPNPVIILAALACGLVWGFMARRFERLLPGIISHALFDWTVIMMFRLWGPSV